MGNVSLNPISVCQSNPNAIPCAPLEKLPQAVADGTVVKQVVDTTAITIRKGSAQIRPLTFGDKHPVLRGIGLTYGGGVAGAASGAAIGAAYGSILERSAVSTMNRVVQGPITGALAFGFTLTAVGMAAGLGYSLYKAHQH